MLGLSYELIEHRLPIKPRFRPHKQHLHCFNSAIYNPIKEEISHLLEVGFVIKPCRYVECVSNIVPVEKKNSKKL